MKTAVRERYRDRVTDGETDEKSEIKMERVRDYLPALHDYHHVEQFRQEFRQEDSVELKALHGR